MNTMDQTRRHLIIQGAVQGVGFRPFIYRLAHEHHLVGWIVNSPSGVELEVQGHAHSVEAFLQELPRKAPPLSLIRSTEVKSCPVLPISEIEADFSIRPSTHSGGISALVLPDMGTCPDCLKDISDPSNRRYKYPFTNCTNCGPRYSIIEKLPYDRPFTSMKHFPMCEDCRKEYTDPLNRRFHAQPNACPVCGPHLTLWDPKGNTLYEKNQALQETVRLLKEGKIIAMKGIGGFQLLVDAENNDAVLRLRQRKGRMGKPFAMMAPDCNEIEKVIELSDLETYWLTRPQAPIVLIEKKKRFTPRIAPEVAGQTPTLGFMLPYSPLHQLLMEAFGGFLVATSGNLSEEPICIDENTALDRLGSIADFFLIHNRPIVRPVDDSVLRIVAGKEMMIRRARGFAPFPIDAPGAIPNRLGVGAELKNTIAISRDASIFVSQHIGDLESLATRDCFEKTIEDLSAMYRFTPETCVSDRHPDYASTRYLRNSPHTIELQHHYTHILSCMAEHQLDCEVLGVAWDGTGLGTDGTIWGGEFFICNRETWKRVGSLRPFFLPGGDRAAKEPRRVALSLLYECFEPEEIHTPEFSKEEASLIIQMLSKGINSIQTTSAGRLFDGFTSLLQLCQINHHEGEAPQALELCASHAEHMEPLHFDISESNSFHQIDWRPIVRKLYKNRDSFRDQEAVDSYAAGLHHAMSEAIVHIAEKEKIKNICLSGGCFQNRLLCESTSKRLSKHGFQVFLHRQIPPNDGGLSAGQLYFKGKSTIPK